MTLYYIILNVGLFVTRRKLSIESLTNLRCTVISGASICMYDFRPLDRQNLIYYSTSDMYTIWALILQLFRQWKSKSLTHLTKSYPSSGTTYWHTYLKYIKICWKHAEKNTAVKFPLATTNFIPIIVNLVQFHPPTLTHAPRLCPLLYGSLFLFLYIL